MVSASDRDWGAALQAQDLGGALQTALNGEPPGTHHMPSMYKAVVRFTDDACQARAAARRRSLSQHLTIIEYMLHLVVHFTAADAMTKVLSCRALTLSSRSLAVLLGIAACECAPEQG